MRSLSTASGEKSLESAETNAGFALTRPQIKTFAGGLYALADCDGIDEAEIMMIREFVEEAGAPDLAEKLGELEFDPATAYQIFGTSWLRRTFLKAALLLIRADGKITDEERDTISWMAMAFGVDGGYDQLVAELEGAAL